MATILMTEEYWRNSQLSIARFYGRCELNGQEYIIVDKTGKDLFHTDIPPGEPADLVDKKFIKFYKQLGRDRFIEVLAQHRNTPREELIKIYKNIIIKSEKK